MRRVFAPYSSDGKDGNVHRGLQTKPQIQGLGRLETQPNNALSFETKEKECRGQRCLDALSKEGTR